MKKKKKIRTTEEQINSVKFYALKLGAIFQVKLMELDINVDLN